MTNEKGFTLIELLVVVAIIGVLAAIAIPQYAEYRVRSFNATAKSDMRNGILGEEAYATEDDQGSGAYVACADPGACEGVLPGFAATVDDQDDYVLDDYAFATEDATIAGRTVTDGKFTSSAHHQNGNITWSYDSEDGQFVEDAG